MKGTVQNPWLLMLVAGMLVLAIAACGGNDDDDTVTDDDDTVVNDDDIANDDDTVEECGDDLPYPDVAYDPDTWTEYYRPTAESLQTHELPKWFKDAKFGIFIHWGPYSVPAYADTGLPHPFDYAEWYWYFLVALPGMSVYNHHLETYGPDVVHDDFIGMWRAAAYDADEWAEIFADAGARYAVLTSKHHDGMALFNSTTTRRDTVNLGPCKDLVGEYMTAMRAHDIKAGLYYSWLEWFHPAYNGDDGLFHIAAGLDFVKPELKNPFTDEPVPYVGYKPEIEDFVDEHLLPQLDELARYYRPDILWLDGQWDLPASYWRTAEVVANYFNLAANENPPRDVQVNDRLGAGLDWNGDYDTAEYRVLDHISERYWEAVRGIGASFGYNAQETEADYLSVNELVDMLVDIVSKNGNLMLNVGPKADGTIPEIMQQRLAGIGAWLEVNGEAIYGTRPWTRFGDGALRYTTMGDRFFILSLEEPGMEMTVPADLPITQDSVLRVPGAEAELAFEIDAEGVRIQLPAEVVTAGAHAWVVAVQTP